MCSNLPIQSVTDCAGQTDCSSTDHTGGAPSSHCPRSMASRGRRTRSWKGARAISQDCCAGGQTAVVDRDGGVRSLARRGACDPVPEPHLLPRFGVPHAERAAQHQLRRQGRVHELVEDEVRVPDARHDPHRSVRRQQGEGRARRRRGGPRPGRAVRDLPGRERAAATGRFTRGAPGPPAWPSTSGARSSRSASRAPPTSSRLTPSCRSCSARAASRSAGRCGRIATGTGPTSTSPCAR